MSASMPGLGDTGVNPGHNGLGMRLSLGKHGETLCFGGLQQWHNGLGMRFCLWWCRAGCRLVAHIDGQRRIIRPNAQNQAVNNGIPTPLSLRNHGETLSLSGRHPVGIISRQEHIDYCIQHGGCLI